MKLQNDSSDELISDINLTPLIDIMLVLLILFMVTSSISVDSFLAIDTPTAASESQTSSPEQALIISLDSDKNLFLDGEQVAVDSLKEEMAKKLQLLNSQYIVIQGDKNSDLQSIVDIMTLAKSLGVKDISIVTNSPL